MSEPMDRAEAERILAAHDGSVFWTSQARGTWCCKVLDGPFDGVTFTEAAIRALDPDRPPSLATLRRLHDGLRHVLPDVNDRLGYLLNALNDDVAETLLARAWELGWKEPKP